MRSFRKIKGALALNYCHNMSSQCQSLFRFVGKQSICDSANSRPCNGVMCSNCGVDRSLKHMGLFMTGKQCVEDCIAVCQYRR